MAVHMILSQGSGPVLLFPRLHQSTWYLKETRQQVEKNGVQQQ